LRPTAKAFARLDTKATPGKLRHLLQQVQGSNKISRPTANLSATTPRTNQKTATVKLGRHLLQNNRPSQPAVTKAPTTTVRKPTQGLDAGKKVQG
jgi:hypothetical protein